MAQQTYSTIELQEKKKIEIPLTHFRMERNAGHELNEHDCPGDKANVKQTG